MPKDRTVKLVLALNAFRLEYEGSEGYLQSNLPRLIESVDKLKVSRLAEPVRDLQTEADELRTGKKEMDALIETVKNDLDSMSEMGEMESLRLQMAMDRLSKMMSTLSNLMKKMSDTAQSIVQNMK